MPPLAINEELLDRLGDVLYNAVGTGSLPVPSFTGEKA
jgi:hypothetical protein